MSDDHEEQFVIDKLGDFLQATRVWVYGIFGAMHDKDSSELLKYKYDDLDEEEKQEINEYLTLKEVTTISKDYIRFDKKDKRFIIGVHEYEKLVQDITGRLVSNLMNGLVAKGQLECAFDDEKQDFIFWKPEKDGQDEEQENI
jgi:hypothetical protein